MRNPAISYDGSQVELEVESGYAIVIDPLYALDLKNGGAECNIDFSNGYRGIKESLMVIEESYFPYAGGAMALIHCKYGNKLKLDVKDICHDSGGTDYDDTSFCIDSGIICVVDSAAFRRFCRLLDYHLLVESFTDEPAFNPYVNGLEEAMGSKCFAFICSPGIGFGFELAGSGRYKIVRDQGCA